MRTEESLYKDIDMAIQLLNMLKTTGIIEDYNYMTHERTYKVNKESVKRTRIIVNDILAGKLEDNNERDET